MKFLFLDLEYASQKEGTSKICEFGYVIIDEKYNVIEKSNIIINPNLYRFEWDYRVLKKILTRKMSEYEAAPTFDKVYDRIVALIESADYVLGHSIDGDAKALNEDCLRYNLPSINYVFYDIKLIYREYKNIKYDVSVTNIMKDLNVEGDEKEHDAEADAYNTMLDFKAMAESVEMSLEELISICPSSRNKNENYEVESLVISRMIKAERFDNLGVDGVSNSIGKYSDNERLFVQFLDNVQPTENCVKDLINQKISISKNYEECHFRQLLNLVQLICNHGGKYIRKASLGTTFITYPILNEDGTLRKCSKLDFVTRANEDGANIKIIPFNEFLKTFDLTEEQLDKFPMVSFDCLCREGAIIKNKKTESIVNAKKEADKSKPKRIENNKKKITGSSIGELCGDFFDKLNKENNKE